MPDYGRRGKPKAGFPPRPQPLEIAHDAISTFPQPRLFLLTQQTNPNQTRILTVCNGKVEIEKHDSHFPTAPVEQGRSMCLVPSTFRDAPINQKGGLSGRSLRSRLQAHSSMRICSGSGSIDRRSTPPTADWPSAPRSQPRTRWRPNPARLGRKSATDQARA